MKIVNTYLTSRKYGEIMRVSVCFCASIYDRVPEIFFVNLSGRFSYISAGISIVISVTRLAKRELERSTDAEKRRMLANEKASASTE